MIRTVVYRSRVGQTEAAEEEEEEAAVYGATGGGGDQGGRREGLSDGDDPLSRIAKYVPGETLGFALPATLFVAHHEFWVYVCAVVGLICTPLYLRWRARRDEEESGQTPPWQYYLIAVLAYVAWILASSSPVRNGIRLPDEVAAALVLIAAYVLPLLDWRADSSRGG